MYEGVINVFNIVAVFITIIATTISIVLWFKSRERDRWAYANFLTIREGLNRIVLLSRLEGKNETVSRIGDICMTMMDSVVASLKTLSPKKRERLNTFEFGYKDNEDKLKEAYHVAGEFYTAYFYKHLNSLKRRADKDTEIIISQNGNSKEKAKTKANKKNTEQNKIKWDF